MHSSGFIKSFGAVIYAALISLLSRDCRLPLHCIQSMRYLILIWIFNCARILITVGCCCYIGVLHNIFVFIVFLYFYSFILGDYDTDEETDRLLNKPYQGEGRVDLPADTQELGNQAMKNKAKEGQYPRAHCSMSRVGLISEIN